MNAQTGDMSGRGEAAATASWITTPITADLLRGALELERTEHGAAAAPAARLGPRTDPRRPAGDGGGPALRRTAGLPHPGHRRRAGHAAAPSGPTWAPRPARTASTTCSSTAGWPARPARPAATSCTIDMATGSAETAARVRSAPCGSPACPTGAKDVEIWLPHNETTELVALRTDAPVEPVAGQRTAGCGCTTAARSATAPTPRAPPRPGRRWPPRSAAWSWSTSGFGGSALLDPFTARAMRDTPADLISVKIGINLVNTDLMRAARVRPGGPRLPRHHPRRPPDDSAAGRLADPVPHPRGHPGPRRT